MKGSRREGAEEGPSQSVRPPAAPRSLARSLALPREEAAAREAGASQAAPPAVRLPSAGGLRRRFLPINQGPSGQSREARRRRSLSLRLPPLSPPPLLLLPPQPLVAILVRQLRPLGGGAAGGGAAASAAEVPSLLPSSPRCLRFPGCGSLRPASPASSSRSRPWRSGRHCPAERLSQGACEEWGEQRGSTRGWGA